MHGKPAAPFGITAGIGPALSCAHVLLGVEAARSPACLNDLASRALTASLYKT
jgi:hypothetical protein